MFIAKIFILGLIDGVASQNTMQTLDAFVKILQIVFYGIGSYVLYTSLYDWHKRNKRTKRIIKRK